jgi:hypothetical protein
MWLHTTHAGRFRRLPCVGGLAGAGSHGKVKLPPAHEGEVRRNPSRLYMVMALPLPPPLLFVGIPPPLVRDRRRWAVSHGGVHLRQSSSLFPTLELRRRAAAPPGAKTPRC